MSCLLAVRLVEAGVRFVTVTFGGWDTHANNFRACDDNLLPPLDQGLAALFTTWRRRGCWTSTTVCVTGEFGRTPKINERAGRDHWPRALLASSWPAAASRGGQVLGASDDKGMGPAGDPITPDQVAASFYHSLGIDHQQGIPHPHRPAGDDRARRRRYPRAVQVEPAPAGGRPPPVELDTSIAAKTQAFCLSIVTSLHRFVRSPFSSWPHRGSRTLVAVLPTRR